MANIEYKRILFATDFSPQASRARDYAVDLAVRLNAEFHLLHVIHQASLEVPEFGMGLAFPGYLENIPEKKHELEALAKDKLQGELPLDWDSVHAAHFSVRFGTPFQEILEYAGEISTDLIVIGTHGRTGMMHALLGSVAERVVQKAKCPVLTVSPAVELHS